MTASSTMIKVKSLMLYNISCLVIIFNAGKNVKTELTKSGKNVKKELTKSGKNVKKELTNVNQKELNSSTKRAKIPCPVKDCNVVCI